MLSIHVYFIWWTKAELDRFVFVFEKQLWMPERWHSGLEHWLFLPRVQSQCPAPTLAAELPVTPDSGALAPSSDLHRLLHACCAQTYIQDCTHT